MKYFIPLLFLVSLCSAAEYPVRVTSYSPTKVQASVMVESQERYCGPGNGVFLNSSTKLEIKQACKDEIARYFVEKDEANLQDLLLNLNGKTVTYP